MNFWLLLEVDKHAQGFSHEIVTLASHSDSFTITIACNGSDREYDELVSDKWLVLFQRVKRRTLRRTTRRPAWSAVTARCSPARSAGTNYTRYTQTSCKHTGLITYLPKAPPGSNYSYLRSWVVGLVISSFVRKIGR